MITEHRSSLGYKLSKVCSRPGVKEGAGCSISLKVSTCKDSLSVQYQDNGRGIPEEIHGKVFDPFTTTKRSEGYLGLGLHILFNLVVQKLDGTVECQYSVAQGVHFSIVFPMNHKDSYA